MPQLSEAILKYMDFHSDRRNVVMHFVGVPLVTIGIFIPLSWFRFAPADIPLTLATVFFLSTLPRYLKLDKVMTAAGIVLFLPTLVVADWIGRMPFATSFTWWVVIFVLGWIIQLVGHKFEGKKPALLDGLIHVLNAPILLTAEIFFMLGLKDGLRKDIEAQLAAYRATSEVSGRRTTTPTDSRTP